MCACLYVYVFVCVFHYKNFQYIYPTLKSSKHMYNINFKCLDFVFDAYLPYVLLCQ